MASSVGVVTGAHSTLLQQKRCRLESIRFDPSTGRKELLKEVMPAGPAGIFWPNAIFMTPDGKGYAYSVYRVLSDLYVVEGLK